ncbi:unnamed protein product [Fraxinus pennsylvanica]|uniref:Helicase ATP-binding domain-containing protein n=1 Tax=Fraxinus pennsylvanica TaxID=56036 RepID=A0AAD1Z6C6_9LAMI|nr:unnamed protein product [Fraxinus pennsylvanica]
MARTGSGKTAALLVPMLQKLLQHVPQAGVRALILSPTRDLAVQTLKFTKELGRFTDLRVSLLVGGDTMQNQFEELAQNPDIIIATPGRLMHHLAEVDDMSLRTVEYVVFDEADCLFSMGFSEQFHKILTQLSENHQTLLFSATLPSALAEVAKAGLWDPQLEEKYAALLYSTREHISSDQQTLIFVSTKYHVKILKPKLFVHRVGRAASAGRTGTAFSLVTSEDMPFLLDLHLFLSKLIRAAPTEEEVLQDMDGIMSEIDQAVANEETVYGHFPQTVVDLYSDRVREIINLSTDLTAMQIPCTRAFCLYSKDKSRTI